MITFHDHVWIWWSHMMIRCDDNIWLSNITIIYDHPIWSSYTIIIFDDHIQWSYIMIIYNDHIWWSYMSGHRRGRGRNLFVVVGGRHFSWKYNIFLKKTFFRVCLKCYFKDVCKKSLKTYQKYYHQRRWTSPSNFWWRNNI